MEFENLIFLKLSKKIDKNSDCIFGKPRFCMGFRFGHQQTLPLEVLSRWILNLRQNTSKNILKILKKKKPGA